jgi:DNA recombination protein RmuC
MLLLILTVASLAIAVGILITLVVTQRTAYQNIRDLHHALSRQEGFVTQLAHTLQQLQTQNQTSILQQQQHHDQILHQLKEYAAQLRLDFSEYQLKQLTVLQENLHKNINELSQHILTVLNQNTHSSTQAMQRLNETVAEHLKSISAQVEKRLSEGFEKTTATFQAIIQRLSLIDEAQKKITELSTNVVSLQAILSDKSSRGAFGEVQLSALIRNFLPENQFSLQHTLSNGKRVDCLLFLPEPTGNIAIDAKFPLENYQAMQALAANDPYRKAAEQRFKQDLKKHIDDIADKYIIAGETADGAVLFLPAEAVFSEIVSYFPDVVEYAQKKRVWLVSPTTLMAILTTARAVIKDQATREQVHIIQQHLRALGKDFDRFQSRMDNLAKHIEQANKDVSDVHISARKITSHFRKIEAVDEDLVQNALLASEKDLTFE